MRPALAAILLPRCGDMSKTAARLTGVNRRTVGSLALRVGVDHL
jgi:hypothetical protein